MQNMKGIAISTLAYMILALITLVFILTLIGNRIYPAVKEVYCNIIRGLRVILPLPENLKTDVPAFCKKETNEAIKVIEIESRDADRIAFNIAAYIAACWEVTGKVGLTQDKLCYELIIKDINGVVSKSMVENQLMKNNIKIDFIWHENIENPTSIAIKYNSKQNKIEVI